MLSKEKLRKADVYTGFLITLLGIWICFEALQMPMRDSYGGVQNVWYVSPAIFPLIIGAVLTLLGLLLLAIAVKSLGSGSTLQLFKDTVSKVFSRHRLTLSTARFLSIASCFVFYIFMNVPRVDFVICSILFLFVFIQSFYPDEERYLIKISTIYFIGSIVFVAYFGFGMAKSLQASYRYITDILNIVFVLVMVAYTFWLFRREAELFRKFKIGLVISFTVPLLVGPIFKYRLLIPLPYEGLTAEFMDFLVYDVFFK